MYLSSLKSLAFLGLTICLFTACEFNKPTPLSEHAIIPKPLSVTDTDGQFEITDKTEIVASGDVSSVTVYLQEFLQSTTGFELATGSEATENSIVLALEGGLAEEGYELDITTERVKISAGSPAGLFYGVQTLRQLLPAETEGVSSTSSGLFLATGKIQDAPEYGYRGAMLDVSRHFFQVEDVKHFIDLIAKYKMNMLHLHLSDDQGWRIEIKSWPLLTTIGGSTQVGGGEGGFYTQEDYKDIVAFGQSRFITIVPEIDMPGHTNSALASYGELNPGIKVPDEGALPFDRKEIGVDGMATPLYTGREVGFSTLATDKPVTYQFVDDVIREISEITPGPYFHIGGDESHVTEMEDYIPFIEKAQEIVKKYGKIAIGWDEVAHASLDSTTIAQFWAKGENAKMAVDQGAKVLISPATRAYLDMQYDSTTVLGLHWAAYIEVDEAYKWEPTELVDGIGKSDIIGVEAPLWTETISNRSDIEYMIFPRITAIAEIAWTPKNLRDWESYKSRLSKHGQRWDKMGINYYQSPLVDWEN